MKYAVMASTSRRVLDKEKYRLFLACFNYGIRHEKIITYRKDKYSGKKIPTLLDVGEVSLSRLGYIVKKLLQAKLNGEDKIDYVLGEEHFQRQLA
jgi:hypothetical protein